MSLEQEILQLLTDEAAMAEVELVSPLSRDSVVMDSGIDSLTFATVVVLLEQKYGVDPFSSADEAFYPKTIGEFIDLYDAAVQSA